MSALAAHTALSPQEMGVNSKFYYNSHLTICGFRRSWTKLKLNLKKTSLRSNEKWHVKISHTLAFGTQNRQSHEEIPIRTYKATC